MNDCIHFDKELGVCKKHSDWSEAMPVLEPCLEGPCGDYSDLKPCPFCGRKPSVHGPEDWEPTFYDPDSGGDPVSINCACGLYFCIGSYDYQETYEAWNRRTEDA